MFEASDRMNHLKKPKPRGQTLPPHAYNMDFSSSMRSNLSNFNSPQHLDDKIEEDQEDPNAGIELLERSDITNDEPVVEGKLFNINFKINVLKSFYILTVSYLFILKCLEPADFLSG